MLQALFTARPALQHGGRPTAGFRWRHVLAGAAGGLILLFLVIDQAPSLLVHLVPQAAEQGWSAVIQAGMEAGGRRCTAPEGTAAVDDMLSRLAIAAGTQKPHFVVVDKGEVNAFTLPDGRIIILRGLIENAGDGDAFAGVLAHEMGHVLHHDSTREALRGATMAIIASALGWGGDVASQMTRLSYSRQAEAAADASAVETLHRAGLRADGLARFFTILEARPGGSAPAFLSDHPSNAARLKAVQTDGSGNPAFSAGQWRAVRDICKKPGD